MEGRPSGQHGAQVTFVRPSADGTTATTTVDLTPEMLAQMQKDGGAAAADLLAKLEPNAVRKDEL